MPFPRVTAGENATACSRSVNIPIESREKSSKPITTREKDGKIILYKGLQIRIVTVFTQREIFPIYTQIFLAN